MSVPATISRNHVIAIVFLVIVLVFSLPRWRRASPGNLEDQDAHRERVMTNEPSVASPDAADPIRTKPRLRSDHPRPTIEETIELVRTTILPLLDFPPDLPLPERIARINELIEKAGVEPYRLRVILNKADPAAHWSQHELRIRKIPLAAALIRELANPRPC